MRAWAARLQGRVPGAPASLPISVEPVSQDHGTFSVFFLFRLFEAAEMFARLKFREKFREPAHGGLQL